MRRFTTRLCTTALALSLGFLALGALALPSAPVGAATKAAHEHLPHTSNALSDIAAFNKTFQAPAPTPGVATPPINAKRVRLANDLPPSNRLSAPIVVLAVVLVLIGFLLYPFRKARRRHHAHQPHDYLLAEDVPDLDSTATDESSDQALSSTDSAELVLQTESS